MGTKHDQETTDALFAGALAELETEDTPVPCLIALHGRPTREVFGRAAGLLAHDEPEQRELGAMVLRELGSYDAEGRRPFSAETITAVLAGMRTEPDSWVLSAMVSVLGHHFAREALGTVLALRMRPEQPVRFAVAAALPALASAERTEDRVVDALLGLAEDADAAVRWYALYALFNETVDIPDERRRDWAAGLARQAGVELRAQLRHLATTLEEPADPVLRELLVRAAG